MRKILIVGANGMLGQELAMAFRDFNLVLYGKEKLDITDHKQVEKIIAENCPLDLIINAAAYTDVNGAETNQELAYQVNGYAVESLARAALKAGAIFIHYSTDYVFDGQKEDGYREDDPPANPVNVYGESKLLGETLLKEVCRKYYLIRTSGHYGRYGKNFVETILRLGQERGKLKVINDQYFRPTCAHDLVKETRYLIRKQPNFGIYHITNEGTTTWYKFAREIFRIYTELTGIKLARIVPCSSEEFSRSVRRPQYSALVNTKWPGLRHWTEAIREYLVQRSNK